MSGFQDPIVAGNTLVREAIESENFETGFTGWRIATDGTAEFNDLFTRGTFTTGPPPDPRIEIGGGSLPTIDFYNDDPGTHIDGPGQIQAIDDQLYLSSPSRDVVDQALLHLIAPDSANGIPGRVLVEFSDDLSGREHTFEIDGAGILCEPMRVAPSVSNSIPNTTSTVFVLVGGLAGVTRVVPPSGILQVLMQGALFNSVAANRTEVGFKIRANNAAGAVLYDGTASAVDIMSRAGLLATYSDVAKTRVIGGLVPGTVAWVEMYYRSSAAGTASIQIPSLIVTPQP